MGNFLSLWGATQKCKICDSVGALIRTYILALQQASGTLQARGLPSMEERPTRGA